MTGRDTVDMLNVTSITPAPFQTILAPKLRGSLSVKLWHVALASCCCVALAVAPGDK